MDVNLISQFIHHKIILFFSVVSVCHLRKKLRKLWLLHVGTSFVLLACHANCWTHIKGIPRVGMKHDRGVNCTSHEMFWTGAYNVAMHPPPQTHASSNLKNYFSNVSKLIILAVHFVKFYIFHDAFP